MKRSSLLILALCFATFGFSQYAVYGSKSTKKFGIAYNINGLAEEDGSPSSIDTLKMLAAKFCDAPDCSLIAEGNKAGWLAVLKGTNEKGQVLFEVAEGNDSKAAAEAMVREKFRSHGGIGEPLKVSSFYVYTTNLLTDSIIHVPIEKQFTITLPRNASTGYSWLSEETDEELLPDGATVKKASQEYKNPSGGGAGRPVGRTGTEVFTYTPKAKGVTIIKFFLMPPGTTNVTQARETKIYQVVVQ